MGVVTGLRATRRGGRVALYVDGVYVCSVSAAMLARRRLYQGLELDETDLADLRREASTERVLGDAHRLLAQRRRSREELRRRLLQKEHTGPAVTATLDRLTADGLLDDAAFAEAYVADKRRLAGWGVERMRRGLLELGVARETVERALVSSSEDELERALALLRRRGAPQPPLEAARRRALAALQRRGFPGSVCVAAVRRWIAGDGS